MHAVNAVHTRSAVSDSAVDAKVPESHVVAVAHWRFELYVGAAVSYCVQILQLLTSVQTRLVVDVGATDSYCDPVHAVSAAQVASWVAAFA